MKQKPTTIQQRIANQVASRKQFLVESKHEQNVCLEEAKRLKVKVITSKDNQHKVYDVVPCLRSQCCDAPVQFGNSDSWPRCNKCGKSCGTI